MSVGILFTETSNGQRVAVIEIDASGMLVLRAFRGGPHPYALRSLESELAAHGMTMPLYRKYADILKQQGKLPVEIRRREAEHYAEILNAITPAIEMGGRTVKAQAVDFPDQI